MKLPNLHFWGRVPGRKHYTVLILSGGACLCLPLLRLFNTNVMYDSSRDDSVRLPDSLQLPTIDTEYWYDNITSDPENNEHMRHTEYVFPLRAHVFLR
jgi:hypothetical protein